MRWCWPARYGLLNVAHTAWAYELRGGLAGSYGRMKAIWICHAVAYGRLRARWAPLGPVGRVKVNRTSRYAYTYTAGVTGLGTVCMTTRIYMFLTVIAIRGSLDCVYTSQSLH